MSQSPGFAGDTYSISTKQIALIHVAKRGLALDDDSYRDILKRFVRVESAADLDAKGFYMVKKYFTALGFRSNWTLRTYGYRPTMATPPQVDLIRLLWQRFTGVADEDDIELNEWLDRFQEVSSLRFVDNKKAAKVISALKAMVLGRRIEIEVVSKPVGAFPGLFACKGAICAVRAPEAYFR